MVLRFLQWFSEVVCFVTSGWFAHYTIIRWRCGEASSFNGVIGASPYSVGYALLRHQWMVCTLHNYPVKLEGSPLQPVIMGS